MSSYFMLICSLLYLKLFFLFKGVSLRGAYLTLILHVSIYINIPHAVFFFFFLASLRLVVKSSNLPFSYLSFKFSWAV